MHGETMQYGLLSAVDSLEETGLDRLTETVDSVSDAVDTTVDTAQDELAQMDLTDVDSILDCTFL